MNHKFTSTALVALLLVVQNDAFGTHQLPFSRMMIRQQSFSTELAAEVTKITMPALSSTMKEGRVVSWLKSEGDPISAGDAIMVVESDKADMDVEAFEDGFLAKIIVGEGEMAPVGDTVALIASEESEIEAVIASFSAGGAGSDQSAKAAATPAAPAAPAAAGTYEKDILQDLVVAACSYTFCAFCL